MTNTYVRRGGLSCWSGYHRFCLRLPSCCGEEAAGPGLQRGDTIWTRPSLAATRANNINTNKVTRVVIGTD